MLAAVGDSIVRAEDSWAEWLARVIGLPLRRLPANGARSDDVVEQLPPRAGERYAVVCLTVGTNDVLCDWDAEAFADRLGLIVSAVAESADRVAAAAGGPDPSHRGGAAAARRSRRGSARRLAGALQPRRHAPRLRPVGLPRVAAGQAPRRLAKRLSGRPFYR